MAVESIEIKAEPRKSGKHYSRALRREEKIPAVVYGPKVKNLDLWVKENELTKYTKQKFENAIFVLKSDDKNLNGLKVLKKQVSFNPVNRRPLHVDFYALDMERAIRVNVELRFEGKAAGIKDGGLFNAVRREVEVECLPTNIPEFFAIDVSPLGVGDSFHVSDLAIPDSIKMITLPTETICTVVVVEEETATPAAAAATAEAAPAAGAPAAAAAPAAGGEKKAEEKK